MSFNSSASNSSSRTFFDIFFDVFFDFLGAMMVIVVVENREQRAESRRVRTRDQV
jgi:hypothetical protein